MCPGFHLKYSFHSKEMGLILLPHRIKNYPDLASTRFRFHSVLKNFHSGERIKKVADSYAGFTGFVWTEAESAKKKLRIKKSVSVKPRLRTAECTLRTRGKMQTECKVQTAD